MTQIEFRTSIALREFIEQDSREVYDEPVCPRCGKLPMQCDCETTNDL